MESPLVSIIVPIYNSAMDMVPCLESIKRQRYENLEVLLVNDGSSDASLEICRMYARLDPRVIIIDKENTGVSGTRNAAIERAGKEDSLPEDDVRRGQDEVQKLTDKFIAEVDEHFKKKEAEVMEI